MALSYFFFTLYTLNRFIDLIFEYFIEALFRLVFTLLLSYTLFDLGKHLDKICRQKRFCQAFIESLRHFSLFGTDKELLFTYSSLFNLLHRIFAVEMIIDYKQVIHHALLDILCRCNGIEFIFRLLCAECDQFGDDWIVIEKEYLHFLIP